MKIYIRDDLPPESEAMAQALYSRNPASAEVHFERIAKDGPEKFMSVYYRGYGHASIGDCGSTTLFIEGVSMLAAKAIQDWPLYRGQEASTRYMDFSNAQIEDPVGSLESSQIQAEWMRFYLSAQKPMLDHLHSIYPRKEDEKEEVYERAINARKFDILRSFLPAGATTNLSWHTDLRQAKDHLDWLVEHPDPTIRILSIKVLDALLEKYPSSFEAGVRATDLDARSWRAEVAEKFTYLDAEDVLGEEKEPSTVYLGNEEARDPSVAFDTSIKTMALFPYHGMLKSRPKYTVLPRLLDRVGQIETTFLLDFGSFRDLQRHRNGVVEMPLLTPKLDFHPWYYEQMPPDLRMDAMKLVTQQRVMLSRMDNLGVPKTVQQYYVAMGFRVACRVTQTLPGFVYRLELRTSPSVHPTLRRVVQTEAQLFSKFFPEVKIHVDLSEDTWDIRRGYQTIIEK
jgi:thymidylate synthase ThyX